MKAFHKTEYKLYKEGINAKIIVASDLHFSYTVDDAKLKTILKEFESIKSDYILFAGDLIDSVDMIDDLKERKRLLKWLEELGNIAKTLIGLGSHDFSRKYYNEKGKLRFIKEETDLFNSIDEINNVHVLDNKVYEDENIYCSGLTLPFKYYTFHPDKTPETKSKKENLEVLQKFIYAHYELLNPENKDKLAIALIHSPLLLSRVEHLLENFDYFVAGHMHNGCVLPGMDELWKSNRGIISPNKDLLPKYARRTLNDVNDKILANGPLTMFHECTGKLQLANNFFPIYYSVMNFNEDFDWNELEISRTYKKF